MTREQIETALGKIRSIMMQDGGDVKLIDYKDGIVKVRVSGTCAEAGCEDCPLAPMDIEIAIEELLKQEIPEIKEVELV
jgi:Fe-S cluster biogenesis protein NfuA